jgi:Phosphotransferase enzyme family
MDAADQILADSIFGLTDPKQIADWVAQMIRYHLHQEIVGCEFWELSVSFTVGLRLADGQRCVLKCRSAKNISLETLQAVGQVQQALADQGFPAPTLIVAPTQFGPCWMSVETLLDVGDNCDAHQPSIRRAMATGLAWQIQLARALPLTLPLPTSRFRASQLWEKPHNALFDFEQTQSGADWIDAIAASAKAVLANDQAPLQIGHMDWSIKNMRMHNGQLSAVYDWDSLRLETEPVIVGNAAKGFLVTWYVDAGIMVPTPEEVVQFVQDYEAARGLAWTAREHRVIAAAFLYSMAYTARCEHAIDQSGEKWTGSFREALWNASDYQESLGGDG